MAYTLLSDNQDRNDNITSYRKFGMAMPTFNVGTNYCVFFSSAVMRIATEGPDFRSFG